MKVYWTNTAVRHLDTIYDYIAQTSPYYARRVVDRLTNRSQQIAEFPFSGRIVPEFKKEDVRELIENPYRLVYLIHSDQIDVLAVVHCAREDFVIPITSDSI